ncbi:MAG: hypothetical protein GQ565_11080 [Candidatus Aegiribacteria sp.]|nr:hypothetical protein [Candidatus Aegiribacteria sp.]
MNPVIPIIAVLAIVASIIWIVIMMGKKRTAAWEGFKRFCDLSIPAFQRRIEQEDERSSSVGIRRCYRSPVRLSVNN